MANSIYRVSRTKIELLFDKPANTVQSYRIQTSPDLSVWTTIATIPAKGSPVEPHWGQNYQGKMYYFFNPADFMLIFPFYVRGAEVTGGVETGYTETFVAYDPETRGPRSIVALTGTAPAGAAIANSVEMILPGTFSIVISNTDGVADLRISPQEAGPETTLAPGDYLEVRGRQTRLMIRGDGAACDFGIQLTLQSNF